MSDSGVTANDDLAFGEQIVVRENSEKMAVSGKFVRAGELQR